MTDTSTTPPSDTTLIREKRVKPPSLRSGNLKDMAIAATTRHHNMFGAETFPAYLQSLLDDQTSIFQKKRPKQETLNQHLDTLDALFTYLCLHADLKGKESSSHSYLMALRAQRQFCMTLKDLKNLKLPPPSKPTPATFPVGGK